MSHKSSGYKGGDDDDVDDSVIVVSEASKSAPRPLSLGNAHRNPSAFSLDLSLAEPKSGGNSSGSQYMGPDIQEKEILIVFDLPDGSQGERAFKLGQTIEVLKSFIESEYGIPMVEQTLFLDMEHADGKRLDNPFSLLDYPDIKGKS
jgi:hypothetical protein